MSLLALAACAHNNPTNTSVDKNHDAPQAVDRVRDATNTNGGLINNSDVERARERTNTNANPK